MKTSPQFLSIQFLRAIAAIAVVLFHIGSMEKKYSPDYVIIGDFWQYGVDLFFVISGFILTYISYDKFGHDGEPYRFFLKRFIRIYPLYWLFSLVVLAVWLLRPEWVNSSYDEPADVLKSFLLWPQKMKPLLAVGWSLIFEVYFYIIFAFALIAKARSAIVILASWTLGTALLCFFIPVDGAPFLALASSPLLFEFMIGCVLALAYRRGIPLSMILLPIMIMAWITMNLYPAVIESVYFRALSCGLLSALLLYTCVRIEENHSAIFPPFICRIGDASYSIYLSHVLVISAITRGIVAPNMGMDYHLLWILSLLLASILAGIAIHFFIEKPFLKYAHSITSAKP